MLEIGGSEDEAIAALLHDAVEDGGGPMMQKRIAWEFGAAVGTMVAENSDSDTQVKGDWSARKAEYIAGMKHKAPGSLRVSLADKLHNVRAITTDFRRFDEKLWDRFTASGKETAGYYVRLAEAFAVQLPRMGPRAEQAIEELSQLATELEAQVDYEGPEAVL